MWIRVALSVGFAAAAATACSSSPPADPHLTEQQQTYVGDLGTIDKRLTGDQARSLQLGTEVCAKIAKGASVDAIASDTQRFTQGEGVIDKQQALALVESARKNLCP